MFSLLGVYWGVGGWFVFLIGYGSDGNCIGFWFGYCCIIGILVGGLFIG